MATNNKKKKKIFIFSGAGLLVIILVAAIIIGGKKEPVIAVQTEKVAQRTITQVVTASGSIQPTVEVKINPEVSGEIVDLPVVEGQRVTKGELLLKIRPDTYMAQVQQNEAALQAAQANLELAKANNNKAQADFNRAKEMYAKHLMSASDLENAKTQYEVTKAQVDAGNSDVSQAEGALKVAQDNLNKTTIHSPMDGVVSTLNSKLGERVLGTNFSLGTEVMDVADMASMEAQVDVDENDVVLVAVGDTAILSVDALPDVKIKGVVYQIATSGSTTGAGTQDQVTNFLVKIRVINPSAYELRPGMSVTADIQTATHNNVLSVPIQSVTIRTPKAEEGAKNPNASKPAGNREKAQEVVFVVNKGTVKAVPVKRGISDDNYVEITSGLKQGEEVVSGSFVAISRELNDGSKVRVENNKTVAMKGVGG